MGRTQHINYTGNPGSPLSQYISTAVGTVVLTVCTTSRPGPSPTNQLYVLHVSRFSALGVLTVCLPYLPQRHSYNQNDTYEVGAPFYKRPSTRDLGSVNTASHKNKTDTVSVFFCVFPCIPSTRS